jgi:hypothetical protein
MYTSNHRESSERNAKCRSEKSTGNISVSPRQGQQGKEKHFHHSKLMDG